MTERDRNNTRAIVVKTANTLRALETVFELSIDGSESTIEVAPTIHNENPGRFIG